MTVIRAFLALVPTLSVLALPALLANRATAAQEDGDRPTFAEAKALFLEEDFAGAAEAYALLLEHEPDNAVAWFQYGYSLHVLGRYEQALGAHVKASTFSFSRKKLALYNAACACSLLGRNDDAFGWLEKAVDAGFNYTTLMQADPDLNNIRKDPRFAYFLPSGKAYDNAPFRGDVRILHRFDGEAAGDQFGWIARNIGDVDRDGVNDIAISAPFKEAKGKGLQGPNAGKIYVYSGKTGELLFAKSGQPGDFLGMGIERTGDVDGDGHADLIAGAPRISGGAGKAFVFSGMDGRTIFTLTADEDGDAFGRDCAGAGDLDGDGHADFLVGASSSNAHLPGAGRAYVFSGKDGALLATLDGEESGDAFGAGINGVTDGEHRMLVIGAGNAGPGHRGLAYVYRWLEDGPELHFVAEADETGVSMGRMFVSFVGDIDGDECPDAYISDWENNARGKNTGRIFVHSGLDGERLLTLTGEKSGDGFGIGTAEAGDVDGDGRDDLVIGAWQSGEGGQAAGKVYLYSGSGKLIRTYVCTTPGDTFGFDTTELGDVDGDGGVDFLITSAWSGIKGPKTGRVFVIAGPCPK